MKYKVKYKILSLFLILFLSPMIVYGKDTLNIKTTIPNVNNPVDYKIYYEVIPDSNNISGVEHEPGEFNVNFQGVSVDNYSLIKNYELDFTDTEYPRVGVYQYKIKQKSVSDSKNLNLSNQEYTIYVQVTYNEDGSLKKTIYPFGIDSKDNEKKDIEFQNTVKYTYISIENRNEGVNEDTVKDVYFKYQVYIDGPVGSTYTINGQDEEVIFEGKKIKTEKEYVVKEDEEKNYIYVYLKSDQLITIGNREGNPEIPIGTKYSIIKASGDNWETTIDDIKRNQKYSTTEEGENYSLIINKIDYDIAKTGVFHNVIPFIILGIIGIVAIILLVRFKIKDDK